MKRIAYAGLSLCALAIALGGCGTQAATADSRDRIEIRGVDLRVGIAIDGLNGCQYVLTGTGDITPRLNSDGSPMCGNGQVRE